MNRKVENRVQAVRMQILTVKTRSLAVGIRIIGG